MTTLARSLVSGAAGALALTAIHETMRRRIPLAPRMDVVAMRGLRRILPGGQQQLGGKQLHRVALAGDLISNSIYYAAIAAPTAKATWTRATVLGSAAGIGALLLPEPIGLGEPPHSYQPANQVMTVAWYLAGALAAAAVANLMAGKGDDRQ